MHFMPTIVPHNLSLDVHLHISSLLTTGSDPLHRKDFRSLQVCGCVCIPTLLLYIFLLDSNKYREVE